MRAVHDLDERDLFELQQSLLRTLSKHVNDPRLLRCAADNFPELDFLSAAAAMTEALSYLRTVEAMIGSMLDVIRDARADEAAERIGRLEQIQAQLADRQDSPR